MSKTFTIDFDNAVKKKAENVYSRSGVYFVKLKPGYRFLSKAAPREMSFSNKYDALSSVYHAEPVS